ncbi:MAG TPA: phosphoribosyltransferase family protein [Solirubrobacteraceae bacterium]|nr:phosphoribosyltransferase family protein [Solirubrobacteraceae bacterium]
MWDASDAGAIGTQQDPDMEFLDRHDAGRRLAAQLLSMRGERPLVIALPRGGVPVAFEVAQALDAPLEVLAVRKLGAPGNPEFGVGAIAEDSTAVLNATSARQVGMTQRELQQTVERELHELRRRIERYRDGRAPLDVRDRTVIVVDDGLATGLTALAAVRALRARGAGRIVVAVPVGARESIALVGEEVDEVVCDTIPRELLGVGHWYDDFAPVSDDEVVELLAGATGDARSPDLADARQRIPMDQPPESQQLELDIGAVTLAGDLTLPASSRGVVIFAHGSGSSRLSPRNRAVATTLNEVGLGTLLFDLLTEREHLRHELVWDIPLLARRLELVTRWALANPATRELPIGYFGASTGAAAAMRAAAAAGDLVRGVVSRGGRPDLAADRLPAVTSPTLLIVGGRDPDVLALNQRAAEMLRCPHRLIVVEGAGHLFEEPGTLEAVAELASDWFTAHLPRRGDRSGAPVNPRVEV